MKRLLLTLSAIGFLTTAGAAGHSSLTDSAGLQLSPGKFDGIQVESLTQAQVERFHARYANWQSSYSEVQSIRVAH